MAENNNTIKTTVELDASQAEKSIDKLNNAKGDSIKLDNNSAKSQGALSKAISKTDEASGGLLTKMKALVANPIGLVVTALVGAFKFLSTAVSRSGKASETFSKIGAKLSGVLNGVLAVAEPLVIFIGEKLLQAFEDPQQAIEDLGNSIKENLINRVKALSVLGGAIAKLFKGDFKGAAKEATDGFIQLGTGITNATDKASDFGEKASIAFNKASKATVDLSGAEKALAKIRIDAEKQQLTSLRLAEEQRQIRDDESKSIAERIQANKDLGIILDEQLQKELALAQQALNFANLQKSATGETIENIEAVGDAELALLEIRERITGQKSEQLVNENSLLKEQKELLDSGKAAKLEEEQIEKEKKDSEREASILKFEEDLARQLEYDELEKERKILNGEATNEIEREILENKSDLEISQARGNAEEIELIEAQKKLALDKLKNSEKKATADKNKAELESNINGAAEAFGVSQELSVAKMVMNAPSAIGNVWENAAKQPTIPQMLLHGAVGSVTTLAPIVKGLKDIKNTRFSKKKGGSSTSGSISSSVGSTGASSSLTSSSASNVSVDPVLSSNATSDAANNVLGNTNSSIVFSENRYEDFREQVSFKEDRTNL